MVNFELVGGVDFQKGCYPGQEVVARSQYRGTTKRRTFLFDCDVRAAAGQDVFHAGDADEPAGTVANAAPQPEQRGGSALVEVRLAALGDGDLRLGGADGAARCTGAPCPTRVPLDAAAAGLSGRDGRCASCSSTTASTRDRVDRRARRASQRHAAIACAARIPACSARLLRPRRRRPTPQTWMETYCAAPARGDGLGVDAASRPRSTPQRARSVGSCVDGPRHVEAFVAVGAG